MWHDLREGDKTPNLDGHLVLIDDTAHPIGTLVVQIKTLRAGTMSYRCSSKLVAYSKESTTLPLILVCVDPSNSRAYWKRVSEFMAGYDRTQQTFTVHFDDALDQIDRGDSCPCYHRWLELTEEYQERIQRYRLIAPENGQQRTAVSLGRPLWDGVQRYADALNRLLDDDFGVVKKLLFPGVWKLGVGCRLIGQEYILCQLSTIPKGEPAPVVFQLPDEVTPTTVRRNVHTSIVRGRKEFLRDPEQCAQEYVLGFVRDLWRAQAFPIHGPEMAADVVLGFVQQNHRWLDLPPERDEYCIADLRRAFGPVLSRSTGLVAASIPQGPSGIRTVDLDSVVNRPLESSASPPMDNVTVGSYVVTSRRVPVRPAFEGLALLSTTGVQTAKRRFRVHDLEYQPPPNNFIWSCYSRQREVDNVAAILSCVLREYELFVRGNGFHLESSPYLNRTASILFEYFPSHDGSRDPAIHEWHVHDPHRALEKATILATDASRPSYAPTLMVNNESFEVIRTVSRSAVFLFMRCPLLNLVYRFLADDLHTQYRMPPWVSV